MTHLNITQGSNIEIVSALIVQKLYETALSVSEPLSGELDAAYLAGNILVNKASRNACTYLTTRFPNFHINVTDDYYIDFADSVLGNKLVSLFSSDGVGLTESEAADAVIYLSSIEDIKNYVTSFDEFNKFTKANGNFGNANGRFRDFVNLASINLTALTHLRGSDFRNTAITTVNAPNLVDVGNQSGNSAFEGCTSLATVLSLGSLDHIPSNCFKNCTDLTTVYIPYECTLIKSSAFSGCTNLTTIKQYNKSLSDYAEGETPVFNDISRVTYYGLECFSGTSITGITNSVILNATYIDSKVFDGKYSDTTLNLPYVTFIGNDTFRNNSSIISVTIGDANNKTCTKVGDSGCFSNCTNLQSFDIENTSVTSLGHNTVTGGNLTAVKLPTTLTTYGRLGYSPPLYFKIGANVTITGLDGVSTVNSSIAGCTILNAIYMPSYISGVTSIIRYTEDSRTYSTTIKQLYYPSFKYCTYESFTANQSVIFNNTFFAYRLRENDSTWVRVNTLYFKDLENIQPYMFYGCLPKNLVINNVTPPTIGTMPTCPASLLAVSTYPTWSTTLFGTIPTTGNDAMTIYVPDSAVSTYQANSYYSSYTILGISNLTKYATEALWEAAGRPDDCLIEEYMS